MVKSSFLGEVARYYADDYIVWQYAPGDIGRVWSGAEPEKDLMVQRYIFLQTEGPGSYKKSSFKLGLRGFIEMYRYTMGEAAPKGIADIAHLCAAAERRTAEGAAKG